MGPQPSLDNGLEDIGAADEEAFSSSSGDSFDSDIDLPPELQEFVTTLKQFNIRNINHKNEPNTPPGELKL